MAKSVDPSAPSSGSVTPLPPRPDLEHLKHQAKRRLDELRQTDPAAKLADAQYAVAKQYGFTSWRELKAHVDGVVAATAGQDVARDASDAAKRGDVDALRAALDQHPPLVRQSMKPFGMGLLHEAAYHGHLDAVQLLIDRDADIHEKSEGDTAYPLHFAAESGHLAIVKLLVEAGSDLHWGQTEHELDVLGWATCFAEVREEVAAYLLERGAKLTIFSAVALGRADEVRRMVEADTALLEKPMSQFEHHRRPLHLAVQKNRPEVVRVLIQLGADVRAKDKLGLTPIGMAGGQTDPAIIKMLLDAGAELGLLEALVAGRFDRAEQLLAEQPKRLQDGGADHSMIVLASQREAVDAVHWLLDHGADVNATAEVWDITTTALHQAAACGNRALVELLLDAGADLTVKDNVHQGTPAGWAKHFGKLDVAELIEARMSTT